MASIFNSISARRPKRNVFDLSHENKLSCNMGDLVPILCEEIVPGDKFRVNTEILMRLAPMLAPVMHRVNVYTHFFFVPNRLVFDGWEKFITGGPDGQDMTVFPILDFDESFPDLSLPGSLYDYLGLPTSENNAGWGTSPKVSALPFRAYQMIYNEYYRDQNLIDPVEFSIGSSAQADIEALGALRKRCWEKDYFTSALPWAQRGGDVHLPLNGTAPVYMNESATWGKLLSESGQDGNLQKIGDELHIETMTSIPSRAKYDPNGSLDADLSDATSSTINEFRKAMRLQEWLEKNARGGSRYIEQILSHFGVRSSDARLQRPEFLGGGKTPVVISEVLQTSKTDNTGDPSPQGNMAGHGLAVGNSHRFVRSFEEHGYIIGIMSILPRTAYQQGIPRHFLKKDKFDYFWPSFAHLGEQEIQNQELLYNFDEHPSDGLNTDVFGYTPRYSEYKYHPSQVHGDFRTSLSYWHMGRQLTPNKAPKLNGAFVTADPTKRIFAVEDESQHSLYVQLYHNIRAIRPMPKFGTPML